MKGMAVIMFGLAFFYDWFWLPNPEINYMSFSYGLAIVSVFFTFFCCITLNKYRKIVREDYHSPANLTAIPPPVMYKMPSSSLY